MIGPEIVHEDGIFVPARGFADAANGVLNEHSLARAEIAGILARWCAPSVVVFSGRWSQLQELDDVVPPVTEAHAMRLAAEVRGELPPGTSVIEEGDSYSTYTNWLMSRQYFEEARGGNGVRKVWFLAQWDHIIRNALIGNSVMPMEVGHFRVSSPVSLRQAAQEVGLCAYTALQLRGVSKGDAESVQAASDHFDAFVRRRQKTLRSKTI